MSPSLDGLLAERGCNVNLSPRPVWGAASRVYTSRAAPRPTVPSSAAARPPRRRRTAPPPTRRIQPRAEGSPRPADPSPRGTAARAASKEPAAPGEGARRLKGPPLKGQCAALLEPGCLDLRLSTRSQALRGQAPRPGFLRCTAPALLAAAPNLRSANCARARSIALARGSSLIAAVKSWIPARSPPPGPSRSATRATASSKSWASVSLSSAISADGTW